MIDIGVVWFAMVLDSMRTPKAFPESPIATAREIPTLSEVSAAVMATAPPASMSDPFARRHQVLLVMRTFTETLTAGRSHRPRRSRSEKVPIVAF